MAARRFDNTLFAVLAMQAEHEAITSRQLSSYGDGASYPSVKNILRVVNKLDLSDKMLLRLFPISRGYGD